MNNLQLNYGKPEICSGGIGFAVWTLIPFVTWSIYLLGVWPGSLSVDSTITWKFSEQSYFDQTHSLIYTLQFMLARWLYDSPGAVAISQILLLSLAHGYAMATLKALGTKNWTLISATVFVALSPLNGFMVSTLWKDVGYATWFYFFFACLIRIVMSRGAWLNKLPNLIFFCFCGILITAYRGNGYPAVIAAIVGLALIKELRWSNWLATSGTFLILLACWLIAINVFLAPPKFAYWASGKSTPLHLLAASYEKDYLSEDEKALLQQIKPENLSYNCRNSASLMFSPFVSVFDIHYHFRQLTLMWLHQVIKHPELYVDHVVCGSKFILSPWRTSGLYHINHGINGLELNPWNYAFGDDNQPKIVQTSLAQIYQWSRFEPLKTIIWWPGFSFWVILVAAAIQAIRTRRLAWLIPAIPILVHSMFLAALVPNDHTRYEFAVLLCMPISLLSLFAGRFSNTRTQEDSALNYHRLFIIMGTLLACAVFIKATATRTWYRNIYEGLDSKGVYLREVRPKIDHREGHIFQDGRPHYLLYETCVNLENETLITINSAQKKMIELTIGGTKMDLTASNTLVLKPGQHFVQVGYKKVLLEPRFEMLDAATSLPIKTTLPREGRCR